MFQLKKWRKGVITRKGREFRITVAPLDFSGQTTFAIIFFLPVLCGLFVLILYPLLRVSTTKEFLVRALLAVIFGVPFCFVYRGVFEKEFAEQIVTVRDGWVTWARRTKFWTRTRQVRADEITDVSASSNWTGFGQVEIIAKGRRHAILNQILGEDAIHLARELEKAVRDV